MNPLIRCPGSLGIHARNMDPLGRCLDGEKRETFPRMLLESFKTRKLTGGLRGDRRLADYACRRALQKHSLHLSTLKKTEQASLLAKMGFFETDEPRGVRAMTERMNSMLSDWVLGLKPRKSRQDGGGIGLANFKPPLTHWMRHLHKYSEFHCTISLVSSFSTGSRWNSTLCVLHRFHGSASNQKALNQVGRGS